ncbi:MAG: response regulator transcription factor [Spirochaetales bacterium]|uniref:Phosphate regulon transcriptional regulatory protein PhoB n=1 Tax=Candidatus Thalassospirochaeta sargassi TaxID=3119039 RepID=A0AAJ1IDN0_9SPIO|nr:response regulator transcription factor [Spirochaetales bacterium]
MDIDVISGHILIIEDDKEISDIVAINLKDAGLETTQINDGKNGLQSALKGGWDLIILDIMLPHIDGITICRRIRASEDYTPIIMLTARAEEIDRVLGLELGADDYMTKPFSILEMTARVKALLRRSQRKKLTSDAPVIGSSSDTERIGKLEINFIKHQCTVDDEPLDLTVKEFELLSLFVRNPGRAYSRADLLNLVWEYSFKGYEHTVNTHINRLRNKIEKDPAHPEYLLTVWGVGYRFAERSEVE